MPTTTEKFDPKKAIFLERILKSWEASPDMRFGELLYRSLSEHLDIGETLYRIEDGALATAAEKLIMKGS